MFKKPNSPLALIAALSVLALVATVVAQNALGVTQDAEYGPHLVTDEGRAVYLYIEDEDGESTCVDACTRNWPPLLAADAEVAQGDGVDASLVGQTTRPDGTVQVTYAGHPLYTFARDTNEGTTRGQKLGDAFFLVAPTGEAILDKLPQERTQVADDVYDALMADGAQVYSSNCAVCHGADGAGGIGPGLAGNSIVANDTFVIDRILNGFIEHGMPPFRSSLDDHQIAAVATFVRDSWGNDFGPILEEEVAEQR